MIGAPSEFLQELFRAAIDAADPARIIPRFLPPAPKGRVVVVGGGKAAAAMARAVEAHAPYPIGGAVVTRDGHTVPTKTIKVIEASHPVPDARGAAGARLLLQHVANLTADDLVLCLMSGGASALLTLPAGDVTIEDQQWVAKQLLRSGANIQEMNTVRKHLSAIAGGRLAAAAHPARVVTLAISDVPGDDPSVIGSGPTVADPTTVDDVRRVLERYRIDPPGAVMAWLADRAAETPKPNDPRLQGAEYRLIASPKASLDAATTVARAHGLAVHSLGDAVEGEAREVARDHARLIDAIRRGGGPVRAPCVVISGGETTVTVKGNGRGGRNAEYLLALGIALNGAPDVYALAGDTDGIDGVETNAGALLGPDSLARTQAAGRDPAALLQNNDAFSFFQALGDLVVTGPTLTNVNDFRAILVLA